MEELESQMKELTRIIFERLNIKPLDTQTATFIHQEEMRNFYE